MDWIQIQRVSSLQEPLKKSFYPGYYFFREFLNQFYSSYHSFLYVGFRRLIEVIKESKKDDPQLRLFNKLSSLI